MNHRNISSKVNKWHCPAGQEPRPFKKRPILSSAIIKRFYQLIQCRHHFLILEKVDETGQLPSAFRHQVEDLMEWVRAPFPSENLNENVRKSSEKWAWGICEVLKSHYESLYEEIIEELSGKYSTPEIDDYRKEAVRRAREQFDDRLKESTVSEFLALDFRAIDSDDTSTKGRQPENFTVPEERPDINHKSTSTPDIVPDTTQSQTEGGEVRLSYTKPVKLETSCNIKYRQFVKFNNYRGLLLLLVLLWFALILICA